MASATVTLGVKITSEFEDIFLFWDANVPKANRSLKADFGLPATASIFTLSQGQVRFRFILISFS